MSAPGSNTTVTISGLESSTNYSIEVAAVNSAGTGVYSDPLTVETSVAGESQSPACYVAMVTDSMHALQQVPLSASWVLICPTTAT